MTSSSFVIAPTEAVRLYDRVSELARHELVLKHEIKSLKRDLRDVHWYKMVQKFRDSPESARNQVVSLAQIAWHPYQLHFNRKTGILDVMGIFSINLQGEVTWPRKKTVLFNIYQVPPSVWDQFSSEKKHESPIFPETPHQPHHPYRMETSE